MIDEDLVKDNRVRIAIAVVVLVVVSLGATYALWHTQMPVEQDNTAATQITTTTRKQGKLSGSSSTTTASTTVATTTTTAPKATAAETTTTQAPIFSASASTTKTNTVTTQCVNVQYTFEAQSNANIGGIAQWEWIRWDGTDTGSTGNITYSSNGETTDTIPPYVLTMTGSTDVTGWVALKLTWDNGTSTSNHAAFTFDYSDMNSGINPSGC